jgi:nitrite reductase (NADH) small subunit
MTIWIEIGSPQDIPARGARVVSTPDGEVAVFRTAAGPVFAIRNRCPHRGGPLSEGIVTGERVTCPLHNWVIDLTTGQAVAPDRGCAVPYPLKVEDGRLWLGVDRARVRLHA